MEQDIIGRYYYAHQGLFPTLLPNTWFIASYEGAFQMEIWGRENAEQAIVWLDRKEDERRRQRTQP